MRRAKDNGSATIERERERKVVTLKVEGVTEKKDKEFCSVQCARAVTVLLINSF